MALSSFEGYFPRMLVGRRPAPATRSIHTSRHTTRTSHAAHGVAALSPPKKCTRLHLDHVERGGVVAGVRGGGAVRQQQALVPPVVGVLLRGWGRTTHQSLARSKAVLFPPAVSSAALALAKCPRRLSWLPFRWHTHVRILICTPGLGRGRARTRMVVCTHTSVVMPARMRLRTPAVASSSCRSARRV